MSEPRLVVSTPHGPVEVFALIRAGDEEAFGAVEGALPAELNTQIDGYALLEYLASESGHPGIAQRLLILGASPSAPNEYGETPAQLAAKKGFDALLAVLVEAGANVNAPDNRGCVALHDCATAVVTTRLLLAGARVDARNEHGETPLHSAVEAGQLDVARQLLDAGAEIDALTRTGATPLALARILAATNASGVALVRELEARGAADPSSFN